MEEYKEKICKLNEDAEFIAYMSAEEENEMFYNTDMFLAREEGHATGLTEGEAKGQGFLINNMISNGYSITEISKMTNISEEEINSLINH